MPIVKGKEFDYTKKGKAAAETARRKAPKGGKKK